jgi:hypothetical protein
MSETSTSKDVPTLGVRVDADDLAAFYRFHSTHSRSHVIVSLMAVASGGIGGFLGAFDGLKTLSPGSRWTAAVASALVFAVLAWLMLRFLMARAARGLIREHPGMLGEFEYRLEAKFIAEIAELHETRRNYREVRQICDTARAVYIYSSAGHAFALPKEKVLAGDLDAFVDELQRRLASA